MYACAFNILFIHLVLVGIHCSSKWQARSASLGELPKTVKTAPRNIYEMANIVNIKCAKLWISKLIRRWWIIRIVPDRYDLMAKPHTSTLRLSTKTCLRNGGNFNPLNFEQFIYRSVMPAAPWPTISNSCFSSGRFLHTGSAGPLQIQHDKHEPLHEKKVAVNHPYLWRWNNLQTGSDNRHTTPINCFFFHSGYRKCAWSE